MGSLCPLLSRGVRLMAAKGSSKHCCCGGCARPIGSDPYNPLFAFCAACQPYQLCAAYQCSPGTACPPPGTIPVGSALLTLPFNCSDTSSLTVRTRWQGVMAINDDRVVSLQIDPVSDPLT